ncbi:hypothetical protein [Sorangium sp. So ce1389]|uniref:hypothetical protein n=1 Tax=Sorangium sp. So ce1389 TaxID=3133336 RepID=UPI003F5D5C04
MKRQFLSKAHIFPFMITLAMPPAMMANCKPSEGTPDGQAPATPGSSLSENDACKNVVRVLATSLITRKKGAPEETGIPFEVDAEGVPAGETVPVCVSVTSVEAKPRVLAAGRFALDGEEVLGPSDFNQNAVNASATRNLEAGSHTLTARIASAPGTKVRVYVYEGSKTPPFADASVMGSAVVVPDQETKITVAGGTFTFLAGAVDAPVPVTIVPVPELYGIGTRFDLYPEGLQLQKPVPVAIPYDPTSLPSTQTEAELLAANAIQVLHDDEWRQTNVDASNRMLHATIEHFSGPKPATTIPISRPFAGYDLYTDDDRGVYIASLPLGRVGYHVSVRAERLYEDPNTDPKELPDWYNWYQLKPVTEHVKGLPAPFVAINATAWGALSGDANDDFKCNAWAGWCLGSKQDLGSTREGRIGVGTFSWSVKTTEPTTLFQGRYEIVDHESKIKNANGESLMVIGSSAQGGLEAHLWPYSQYADADAKLNEIKSKPGGHAVLLGANIWNVNRTIKAGDPCEEVPDSPSTIVAIAGDGECTTCKRRLLLITSMYERNIKEKLCKIDEGYHVIDAIAFDGGDSPMMVQNHRRIFDNQSHDYGPARNVVNALALAYEFQNTSISAPACSAVNAATVVKVVAGVDPNGSDVTLRCASPGSDHDDSSPHNLKQLRGGNIVWPSFAWSSPGSKQIYCTTFRADGQMLSNDVAGVEVGRVDSVTPPAAKIDQLTTFIISGENLCDSTVAWIPHCPYGNDDTLATFPIEGGPNRYFQCTPRGAEGMHEGVVKTWPDGTSYRIDTNGGKLTFPVSFVQ